MQKLRRLQVVKLLLILTMICTMISGCMFGMVRKNEERLNKRIKEYWDARLRGDYKTAYEYECAQLKAQESYEMYYARKYAAKSELEKYEIAGIQYDKVKDEYLVKVRWSLRVTTEITNISFAVPRNEIWKFEDGDWYRRVEENKQNQNLLQAPKLQ